MNEDAVILIAEDNRGHFILTQHCLQNAGIANETIWFTDGQYILDFLFKKNPEFKFDSGREYILLLDIRMPKVDGIKVLETIKHSGNGISNIPIIMISTSDNPAYIAHCNELGCSGYVVKPLGGDFIEAVQNACQCI